MALPLWNSKTAHTTQLCLHPNDGVSLRFFVGVDILQTSTDCFVFFPQNVVEKFSLCQVRCFSVLVVWLRFFGAVSPRMTKNQRQNHKEPNTLFVEPRKMSSQQKGATCFYLTTPFFPVHRQPFVATFAVFAIAKRFCCDDVSVRFL